MRPAPGLRQTGTFAAHHRSEALSRKARVGSKAGIEGCIGALAYPPRELLLRQVSGYAAAHSATLARWVTMDEGGDRRWMKVAA